MRLDGVAAKASGRGEQAVGGGEGFGKAAPGADAGVIGQALVEAGDLIGEKAVGQVRLARQEQRHQVPGAFALDIGLGDGAPWVSSASIQPGSTLRPEARLNWCFLRPRR